MIPLPEYYNKHTPEKLIEEVFRTNNINENDIKSLINDYEWLFILDGYDEIKLKANLFEECDLFFKRFNLKKKKQHKYIITCRKEYIEANGLDKKEIFTPKNEDKKDDLNELQVRLFEKGDIDDFIIEFCKIKEKLIKSNTLKEKIADEEKKYDDSVENEQAIEVSWNARKV